MKPKLTPWFDEYIKPVHIGLYEVLYNSPSWSFWNGKRWGYRCIDQKIAFDERFNKALGPVIAWRGLAKKP